MPTFYEFFAGGGMARAGLGPGWACLFANDFDAKKGQTYRANWGDGGELVVGDVRQVAASQLPGRADLIWGSFPCQDLSLAGAGAGLKGERSGTFYPFWNLITDLQAQGRAPTIVALENVCGALTSHQGRDFEAICSAFSNSGYRFGALVINAELFVPQSRPRLFLIGIRRDVPVRADLTTPEPLEPFHPASLQRAVGALSEKARRGLAWWRIPSPPTRSQSLSDLTETNPDDVSWHNQAQTKALLDLMSPVNLAKVEAAKRAGRRMIGGVYRRTRPDASGRKTQRAEVRFDHISGCLRTPAGGSSRQIIMVVEGYRIRTRLISARETARLMGLPDSYRLPSNYNEAYHLTGDGVVAPVVRHLAAHLFEPLLLTQRSERKAA
jgi:DNA (cytosine-5)-methyltransferase 1